MPTIPFTGYAHLYYPPYPWAGTGAGTIVTKSPDFTQKYGWGGRASFQNTRLIETSRIETVQSAPSAGGVVIDIDISALFVGGEYVPGDVPYYLRPLPGTISYPDTADWYGVYISSYQILQTDPDTGAALAIPTGSISPNPLFPRYLGFIGSSTPYFAVRDGHQYSFGVLHNEVYTYDGRTVEMDWGTSTQTVVADLGVINDFTHTFSGSDGTITWRTFDSFGRGSALVTLKLPPVASLEITNSNDPLFDGDFSGSFDPDGTIVSYTPEPGGVPQSGLTYEWDLSDIEDATDATTYELRVVVTDDDGLTDYATATVNIEPGGDIGVTIDHTKTIYTAVGGGGDVMVYRMRGRGSTIEPIYRLDGAKNPSLFFDQHGRLCLAAQLRSSGDCHLWRSDNRGDSFDRIT